MLQVHCLTESFPDKTKELTENEHEGHHCKFADPQEGEYHAKMNAVTRGVRIELRHYSEISANEIYTYTDTTHGPILYHFHFNKDTFQTISDVFQTKSDTFHTKQDTFHFKLDTFQIKWDTLLFSNTSK